MAKRPIIFGMGAWLRLRSASPTRDWVSTTACSGTWPSFSVSIVAGLSGVAFGNANPMLRRNR